MRGPNGTASEIMRAAKMYQDGHTIYEIVAPDAWNKALTIYHSEMAQECWGCDANEG